MSVMPLPPLPTPPAEYSRENEAQYRAALERVLREIIIAVQALEAAP